MRLRRREVKLLFYAVIILFAIVYYRQLFSDDIVFAQALSSDLTVTAEPTPTSTLVPGSRDDNPVTAPITTTYPITETILITPTVTISATLTPTPSETPTPTPTLTPNPFSFLPLIIREPTPIPYIPPEKVLFCDSLAIPLQIPDNNPYGISHDITPYDQRLIVDLDIDLRLNHTWVGDLFVTLSHLESGKMATLVDRPGIPATNQGCEKNNIFAILDDEISSPAEGKCASSPAAISGIYQPSNPLSIFDGDIAAGTWRLNLSDNYQNDTGYLSSWCLVASISPYGQTPTPVPPPPPSPAQVQIYGVTGRKQALPLDCESRSAVDWAAYFGYRIGELAFYSQLPHSDNPDKGFVGNVNGTWGQIPPNPYGVHAEPVAALLRQHGVPAYAHRPLSWEHLKAEIAAGRPVFVWIVGSVENGIPVYYTPPDGLSTIVAHYEHTVVVTGYSESKVYYLNGDTIYTRPVEQFLDSWSALGNMAIITHP